MSNLDYNAADNEATDAELAGASQPAIGAGGFGKQQRAKQQYDLDQPTAIADDAGFTALKPGQKFIGPDGQTRVKPFTVANDLDFEHVPEGAQFVGPDGQLRQKPKFEGLGYSAQTLYSMALTEKEKRKILQKYYPGGQIQGEGDNLHVIDENGTYRKPGRLNAIPDTMGAVAGNIAPMALSVVGSGIGAAGGSAIAPGPGSFGGGVAGGMAGGLVGQRFNDIILNLSGVYDRTPGEQLANDVGGMAMSAAGDLVGRGAAAVIPSAKVGVSKLTHAAPDFANKMLGTNADDLARARRIAELGEGEKEGTLGLSGSSTSPGASTYAPGAPYLQMLQETMHEKFTTEGTRRKAAERAYEKEVDPLIESMVAGKQIGNASSKVPQSVLSSFPDMPVSQGGGIGLNSFSSSEREALRDAGLIERFTNDAGESYEGVSAQRLWELRDAAKKGGSTVDDIVGPPTKEAVRRETDKITGNLLNPEAAISSREAGEKLQLRALQQSQQLDAEFEQALAVQRRAAELGVVPEQTQREAIERIAQERHRNASQLINSALQDVERNADQAVLTAANGSNTGGLWENVGRQLLAVKQAMTTRYGNNAQAAFQTVPRGTRIRVEPLVDAAEEFIGEMPEEFAAKNPALVRRIRALGRRPNPDYQPADEATGTPAVGSPFLPPQPMTLAELHQLRTDLREVSDYHDLPSSFRNFATKNFAHQTDQLMHAVGDTPQFNAAIRMLDDNDAWYAAERPIFNARELQATVRALESGQQADPEMLFKALVKDGKTDMIGRVREVVGPQLWHGIQGAQQQTWLQAARKGQLDNTVDAKKFAEEVADAHRLGTLEAVQGPERAQQLLTLAHQIGALDGSLPVTFRPGDTALDVFRQAHLAVQQADQLASRDPLAALQSELKKRESAARGQYKAQRGKDQLKFLEDRSFGEAKAVDRILGNEDLILATAERFGDHSPEFNALRQVWIERVFKGNMNPGKGLGKATPEIQRLMMGVNVDTARKIAEDMEFIMGSRALRGGGEDGGQSIQAASKLAHPLGGKTMSRVGRLLPGANAAARAGWQAYYSTIDKIMSSPSLLRWLEKSYQGGEQQRAAIRDVLSKQLQRAGMMGAGLGAGVYELGREPLSLPQ